MDFFKKSQEILIDNRFTIRDPWQHIIVLVESWQEGYI
jgi:hypothetical protein